MRLPILFLCLAAFTGCARYEFDIVEPADLARHVGRSSETVAVFQRDALQYRLQAYEGRLVMRIINPNDEAIDLLGDRSWVVDPGGQSHPIRPQSIAPNSFIKIIFPPMPRVYRTAPTFGVGIGVGFSHYHHPRFGHRHYPFHDSLHDPYWGSLHDRPQYLAIYGDDTEYWSWTGQSSVQIRLAFRRGEQTFHHDFVIKRVKA